MQLKMPPHESHGLRQFLFFRKVGGTSAMPSISSSPATTSNEKIIIIDKI